MQGSGVGLRVEDLGFRVGVLELRLRAPSTRFLLAFAAMSVFFLSLLLFFMSVARANEVSQNVVDASFLPYLDAHGLVIAASLYP